MLKSHLPDWRRSAGAEAGDTRARLDIPSNEGTNGRACRRLYCTARRYPNDRGRNRSLDDEPVAGNRQASGFVEHSGLLTPFMTFIDHTVEQRFWRSAHLDSIAIHGDASGLIDRK